MTLHERIAATECIRLIGLLVHNGSTQAKSLALIVGLRLRVIVEDNGQAGVKILPEAEILSWNKLMKENTDPEITETVGADQS